MKTIENLFAGCMLLIAFSACTEDEVASTLTYPEGKLKMVSTYGIAHDNSVAEVPYHRREFFYNSNELLVKEENYFQDDHKYRYFDYTYDDAKRLVMKRLNTINPDNETYRTNRYTTYEYDERGRLSKKYSYKDDGSRLSCMEYMYIGDTAQVMYNCMESRKGKDSTTFIYYEDRLVRESYYSYDGAVNDLSVMYEYRYEYDAEGKLLNKKWINGITNHPDGVKEGIEEEYFYNERGQLIESRRYDPHWHFAYVDKKVYEYY